MTGAKVLVMVGDGATDLEAKQDGGADMFVGYVKLFPFHSKLGLWEISNVSFPTCFFVSFRFGGIVQRETVLKQADWAVYDFQDLTKGLR